ncbi:LOW QUALITY PROTEIN: butyrophilin-like protein 8 [Molossus nigricans]
MVKGLAKNYIKHRDTDNSVVIARGKGLELVEVGEGITEWQVRGATLPAPDSHLTLPYKSLVHKSYNLRPQVSAEIALSHALFLPPYPVDVTLDPDTAHPQLYISDLKAVSYRNTQQNVPYSEMKFTRKYVVGSQVIFLDYRGGAVSFDVNNQSFIYTLTHQFEGLLRSIQALQQTAAWLPDEGAWHIHVESGSWLP